MVTTQSSGSNFLNRVELLNGCTSLAHAILFIPSTLYGLPLNSNTGLVNEDSLVANLNQAADLYIERVDQCPCGYQNSHV